MFSGIGTHRVSVANSVVRTNNAMESFNRPIRLHMSDTSSEAHPNIWMFLGKQRIFINDTEIRRIVLKE